MGLFEELENKDIDINIDGLLQLEKAAYEEIMVSQGNLLDMFRGRVAMVSEEEFEILVKKSYANFSRYLGIIARVFRKIDSNWTLTKYSCVKTGKIAIAISHDDKLRGMLERYNELFNAERKIEELFYNRTYTKMPVSINKCSNY